MEKIISVIRTVIRKIIRTFAAPKTTTRFSTTQHNGDRNMTIEKLETLFWRPEETIETICRDSRECKVAYIFRGVYSWDEAPAAHITQLHVKYDCKSHEVTTITVFGLNLQSISDYVDRNSRYLWNDIKHYITHFNSVPQKIFLFTPAYTV